MVTTDREMKRCKKCNQEKCVTEFYLIRKTGHKRHGACRECMKRDVCEYRQNNPEKIKATAAGYRQRNQQRVKDSYAKWRSANRQAILEKEKQKYVANRENCIAKARDYRRKYPDRIKATRVKYKEVARIRMIEKMFGLTAERHLEILQSQGGGCGICGEEKSHNGKSLCVDHCHETGEVRGLLCDHCNRGIGLLGDSADGLIRACAYLLKQRITKADVDLWIRRLLRNER